MKCNHVREFVSFNKKNLFSKPKKSNIKKIKVITPKFSRETSVKRNYYYNYYNRNS